MNTRDAATRLDTTRRYIARLVAQGKLAATKPGGRDFEITESALLDYEAIRRAEYSSATRRDRALRGVATRRAKASQRIADAVQAALERRE